MRVYGHRAELCGTANQKSDGMGTCQDWGLGGDATAPWGLKSRKSKFWGLESLMSVSNRANFTHLHGKSGGVGGKGGSTQVLILSNQAVEPTPSIPATRAKRWNFYELTSWFQSQTRAAQRTNAANPASLADDDGYVFRLNRCQIDWVLVDREPELDNEKSPNERWQGQKAASVAISGQDVVASPRLPTGDPWESHRPGWHAARLAQIMELG